MQRPIPPLVVSRQPRRPGPEWSAARSWLGGAPRLGDQPWPRHEGKPLTFMAQIDWRDVHAALGPAAVEANLPEEGALAFFLPHCAVVGVAPGSHAETPAPPDLPVALQTGGDLFPEKPSPGLGITAFPYWPVTLAPPPPAGAKGRYFLGVKQVYEAAGLEQRLHYWHTGRYVAASLRTALHTAKRLVGEKSAGLASAEADLERAQPKRTFASLWRKPPETPQLKKAQNRVTGLRADLERWQSGVPDMERLVAEADAWTASHTDWAPMTDSDWERLRDFHVRGRDTRARSWLPYGLDDLESTTLVAMATAPDEAYRTFPEALRNAINDGYCNTPDPCHQMFGQGVDIQGNAAIDNEGAHMLLQLMYDDMLRWIFGDMGAYQFWIDPEDLDARNWAAARVTFECG
ncbi:MAG: DUF1963 domain-containing protein [Bryobacterales bacterium]|nr:DUF1963 domain-containing protein [Acidobacteriota bacterium]MCB9384477.1 DUF1963 domain-containing protein [Bryobacterales bacterium]